MQFNAKGILGINARNLLYIRPYNRKKAIKLADDKIKTKQFLAAREIPVPKLYGIIRDQKEIEKFDFNALPNSFVLKPNHGFGGEGIVVIVNKRGDHWITAGSGKITKQDLIDHIYDILDGRFSISNVGDSAFFEQYVISDDIVGKYSYEGLPDIRVVVHNLIPVMAMLRLPTKESGGKANLHLGAIGVGIDIAKGETTFVANRNKIIDKLPDGLGDIRGLKIPNWDEILLIASKVQLITNLGYLAADICLDQNTGPVLLEINARAGLGVQIANLAPLRKRLERIEGVKVSSPIKGVRIAKDMFGNIVEKEIESLSGKQVVGVSEDVEIIQKIGTNRVAAKIDTGEDRSIIDEAIALKLGLLDNTKDYDDEKSTLKLKFTLKGKRIQTVADVEKIPSKKFNLIVGNRDLKDFLVDSSISEDNKAKTQKKPVKKLLSKFRRKAVNYYQVDQDLIQIDNKIKLLFHLRPTNLESEKKKFLNNFKENPQFEYPNLKFDPLELVEKLGKIKVDDSPLGKIFSNKKKEIAKKIALLESVDEERFSEISIQLFGKPTTEDVEKCSTLIKSLDGNKIKNEEAIYSSEEAKNKFEEVFKYYNLDAWQVKIKEDMVANCVAGKNNRLFVNKDAKFSMERIESLIIHEIETHIITAENGKNQPYEIFNRGLANYLETQEGLAMYNVEKQRHVSFEKNFRALSHVIAINKALSGSFVETFEEILAHGLPIEIAFRSALKAKRGFADTSRSGAFTKDYIYYDGYNKVKKFLTENDGKLEDLYLGKVSLDELDLAMQIHGIQKARLLPKWLKK